MGDGARQGGRARERALSVALLAAFSALCFGLAEGGLQLLYRVKHDRWYDGKSTRMRVSRTTPVEDLRRYTLTPDYAEGEVRINSTGFRGAELGSWSGEWIAVVGDSVPYGMGVANHETYPVRLEEELRRRGFGVRTLNGGVPSYNLLQATERLEQEVLPHIRPRAVVLNASNDVTLLAFFGEDWTPDSNWGDLRHSSTWVQPYQPLLTLRLVERVRLRLRSGRSDTYGSHDPTRVVAHVSETIGARVEGLTSAGIAVVLVSVNPFFYQGENLERNADLSSFAQPEYRGYADAILPSVVALNEALAALAARLPDVHFVDVRPVMDGLDREVLFHDFIHLSEPGNRVMASALADALQKAAILDPEVARVDTPSDPSTPVELR